MSGFWGGPRLRPASWAAGGPAVGRSGAGGPPGNMPLLLPGGPIGLKREKKNWDIKPVCHIVSNWGVRFDFYIKGQKKLRRTSKKVPVPWSRNRGKKHKVPVRAVLRNRIRIHKNPHHLGNLDPQQIKIRIRFRTQLKHFDENPDFYLLRIQVT
jgi:hypothetical protein